MAQEARQAGDKKIDEHRPEDPSHPGMSPDPVERGKQLGHENAYGGQSVGTGGHGTTSGGGKQSHNCTLTHILHTYHLF